MSTDMASARSVSENHLLAMIIYEFKNIDATEAIRNVPSRIGQNSSTASDRNRSIAPEKDINAAILKTVSVWYRPNR